MSNYTVDSADLTSVASAIRTKGGTSAQLEFPAGFVSAIEALPSGGGSDIVLLNSGDYTYIGEAAGSFSIPVTYSGVPVYAYAVIDQPIADVGQTYCCFVFTSDWEYTQLLDTENGHVGLASALYTSDGKIHCGLNPSVSLTATKLNLSRHNNSNRLQPNTYHWYIYGEAST